jgi:hypothetical protein
MTNPRPETRNNSDKGKKSVHSLSQVSHGGRCNPAKRKGGDELGKRLAALSNPAWSYELAAQEDRILAAWVMAPPIFYRNFCGGRRLPIG